MNDGVCDTSQPYRHPLFWKQQTRSQHGAVCLSELLESAGISAAGHNHLRHALSKQVDFKNVHKVESKCELTDVKDLYSDSQAQSAHLNCPYMHVLVLPHFVSQTQIFLLLTASTPSDQM